MTAEPILAWHFVAKKLRDGRPIPADGVPLIHDGEVIPCEQGLHASMRIIDALTYAPGETICRVSCAGQIVQRGDKLVCSERTILWRLDATGLLREFARQCALDVAHLWDMPDIVRQYLETGNETIRDAARTAARTAAQDAARTAARTAAQDAAWYAAQDAAWTAAWYTAQDAASAAASAAARGTARDAARDAQNNNLEAMINAAVLRKNHFVRSADHAETE